MADLYPHYCDKCVQIQKHVKFESGKLVVYTCTVCKSTSMGKTLRDLMEGAKPSPTS